MYLKRLYHPRTDPNATPTVRGVRILRAKRIQNLSPSFIDGGEQEGWLTRSRGGITIHGEKGDVEYRIAERPGLYCCHTGDRIADVGDYPTAQKYIAEKFAGVPSPDPQNPSGYRANHGFTLVLVGPEVEDLTPEEAKAMAKGVRDTLAEKLRAKYGNTRAAAERRNAAKARVGKGG